MARGRDPKNPYKGADRFTVAAKQQGYPARSVFKLEEIDRRIRLLRQGMHVLDLGAAPGSWMLYAAQKIGGNGKLLAVDLQEIGIPVPQNATFLQGDALSLENETLETYAPYDVVLSDMAPNTTGNRIGDQTRSFELFMRALAVAEKLAKPGGAFVGKIFMGEDFTLAKKAVKRIFGEERAIRPEGTRTNSYELFLVGLGKKAAEVVLSEEPDGRIRASAIAKPKLHERLGTPSHGVRPSAETAHAPAFPVRSKR